ncbi:MAG: hypothetical protein CMH36_00560 [Microbacterium sp.]|uniref:Uncharacterized protein n=1 Tax=Microbacterium ginsengisoli TaxID=400772 RepID=A0A0F0LZB9_9MICO|nr:hypothetical protein [Microbacterium ginsengisoli]KJL38313.1 hypothetical protein RR49_00720 [Microbacterium ginsengisoli]MAL05344.1 hypothetical protein [Microbacterium sp.]MBN9207559.1 hypothetical protein [Microbacterium ginsengisoli]HAN24839.1 hypothetical protein [Microbacterium ginsengisoli]
MILLVLLALLGLAAALWTVVEVIRGDSRPVRTDWSRLPDRDDRAAVIPRARRPRRGARRAQASTGSPR